MDPLFFFTLRIYLLWQIFTVFSSSYSTPNWPEEPGLIPDLIQRYEQELQRWHHPQEEEEEEEERRRKRRRTSVLVCTANIICSHYDKLLQRIRNYLNNGWAYYSTRPREDSVALYKQRQQELPH